MSMVLADEITYLQRLPGGLLENLPDPFTCLSAALDVTLCPDLLRDSETVFPADGALIHPTEILQCFRVIAEVLLACDEYDGEALAEM